MYWRIIEDLIETDCSKLDEVTCLDVFNEINEFDKFLKKYEIPNLSVISIVSWRSENEYLTYIPKTVIELHYPKINCPDLLQLKKLSLSSIPLQLHFDYETIEELTLTIDISFEFEKMLNLKTLQVVNNNETRIVGELTTYRGFNGFGNLPTSVIDLIYFVNHVVTIDIQLESLELIFTKTFHVSFSNEYVKYLRLTFEEDVIPELFFPNIISLSIHSPYKNFTQEFVLQYSVLETLRINNHYPLYFPNLFVTNLFGDATIITENFAYHNCLDDIQLSFSIKIMTIIGKDTDYLKIDHIGIEKLTVICNINFIELDCPNLTELSIGHNTKVSKCNVDKLRIGGSVDCSNAKARLVIIHGYKDNIVLPYDYEELTVHTKCLSKWIHPNLNYLTVMVNTIEPFDTDGIIAPNLKVVSNCKRIGDYINCEKIDLINNI